MARNRVTGKGSYNAYCQSCGRKFKNHELMRRPEDNLLVCKDDWEPIHPQKFVRVIPDQPKLPFVLNVDEAGGTQLDISGNTINPQASADATYATIIHVSGATIEAHTTPFTVYKISIDRPVTLVTTMTVATGGFAKVDGVTNGAGDYTGASSGW